mmetsp:Transcript_110778/g.345254  ORF Transcript_110778/g.345254 Transcript_110778/m.345254 type:complete len:391 (-) Transcript_110778:142-1314(-)
MQRLLWAVVLGAGLVTAAAETCSAGSSVCDVDTSQLMQLGSRAAVGSPRLLTDTVKDSHYNLGATYKCGNDDPRIGTTRVFYPDDPPTPHHVAIFVHGSGGWTDEQVPWLKTVASKGLIVIAPQRQGCKPCKDTDSCTNPDNTCSTEPCVHATDVNLVIEKSKEGGGTLHPVLKRADWSRIGIFGHSMGARYTPYMIKNAPSSYNIKAFVGSHGGVDTDGLEVPSMFTTTADDNVRSPASVLDAFNAASAKHKVFVELKSGGHHEPNQPDGGQLSHMTAYFLAGHVNLRDDYKALIYGSGPESVCKDPSIDLAEPLKESCVRAAPGRHLVPPGAPMQCGDGVSWDCQSEYNNAVTNSDISSRFCHRCRAEGGSQPLRTRCKLCCLHCECS